MDGALCTLVYFQLQLTIFHGHIIPRFQNNPIQAGYAGLLSFGVCFRKGCYYSQMGCVLLQTRQTLSRAPVSTLLFNERLEQRGGRKEDQLYSMKPQVWFYPFKHPFFHSVILFGFLSLFFSFLPWDKCLFGLPMNYQL